MIRLLLLFFFYPPFACSFEGQPAAEILPSASDSIPPAIDPSGKTVETRFPAPVGYLRTPANSASFTSYLRQMPLLPDSSPVLLFDGRQKTRQDVHCAVLDLDTGARDLQQCADAVIRLRAEYLYKLGRYTDIHFNFSNGFRADYTRWRRGERIRVEGNRAYWVGGGKNSESYNSFRAYLDMVFAYAGTASLERELDTVGLATLQAGDVWIDGGYPGHAVLVLDVAEQPETGKRLFLLAQSYMPAQQIHVLRNPADNSPWYATQQVENGLETPEWSFEAGQLRRWRP